MRVLLRLVWRHNTLRIFFIAAGVVNLASFLVVLALPRASFALLAYNVHVGINATGPWWHAFGVPLVGLALLVVNYILTAWFFLRDQKVSYILTITALMTQVFVVMGQMAVVVINRS
jgi:hypothetical protein